jgi:predicted Zn-dependent protease
LLGPSERAGGPAACYPDRVLIRIVAALALALLAGLAAGCTSDEERAERAWSDARAALARADPQALRESLAVLRAVQPDDPDALLELTTLMAQAGEAPQALWLLEAGIGRFPSRDDLRVQLGHVALILGNPARARSAVEAVAENSPEHLSALLVRAQSDLALGDLDRALETLEAAAHRYPDDPRVRTARIATLVRERRLPEAAEAIADAKRAGIVLEGSDSLDVLAARIEIANEDAPAALDRLEARTLEDPTDLAALELLVALLLGTGRGDDAAARVTRALEAAPEQLETWRLRARVELARGNPDAAEAAMVHYAERTGSPTGVVALSRFYASRGDPARAAAVLDDGVRSFPDDAMLRMHLAESWIDVGRLGAAEDELARFRERSPGDPHVAYLEARLALARGDAAAAATTLSALVPRLDRAYTQYWLGRALEARGDAEGAERRYGLSLLRDPGHDAAVIALLRLAEQRAAWDAVAGYAVQLVERAPQRSEGYATAVTALVRAGEPTRAEAIARLYRARFPEAAEPVALLVLALRAQGRSEDAWATLAEVPERAPVLRREEALLLASEGRDAEAIAMLHETIAAHPEAARLQATLAALLFRAGDGAGGSAATDRALALDPDDLAPLKLRARFRAASGAAAAALRDCDRYLAERPRDAEVHFMRGVLLAGAGRNDEAEAAYRRTIALDERAFAARNNLALLLEASGRPDEALEVAQQAYALAADRPEVVDTLGVLYLRHGLPRRGAALLEKAHASDPQRPLTRLHLALAYREVGRPEESRALLEALIAEESSDTALTREARVALRELQAQ